MSSMDNRPHNHTKHLFSSQAS